MVSPSKKKKLDKKGTENGGINPRKESGGLRKSSRPFRPLVGKKFYLDIKSHVSLAQVEKKLKILGATVELFLVRDVNYVISDRKDCAAASSVSSNTTLNNCPSVSQSPSASPSPSPATFTSSPADGLGQKKSRTRAEAMLERVRLQPQRVAVDPLDNARTWNIPIYSLETFLYKLDRLCAKSSRLQREVSGVKILKGNYLKIETDARPEFRELGVWPSINITVEKGVSPFTPVRSKWDNNENSKSHRMTRKLGKTVRDDNEQHRGGYCELCSVDYAELKTHIASAQHIKCATNSDQYAQLDALIRTKGVDSFLASHMCPSLTGPRRSLRSGSVDIITTTAMGNRNNNVHLPPVPPLSPPLTNGQFARTRSTTLHLRQSLDETTFAKKQPLEVQCNGVVNHCHFTRHSTAKSDSALPKEASGLELQTLSKRSRTISASCPSTAKEMTQLSPTGSDIATHHLRSRKQIWLPASLLGTTAEDELTTARSRCRNTPSPVKLPSRLRSPSPVKNCGRNSIKSVDSVTTHDEVLLPNKIQSKNLKIMIDSSTNINNHNTPLSPKHSVSCSSRNSFKPIETLKLDLRSPSPIKHVNSSNNRHSPKTLHSPVKESNFVAAKTVPAVVKRRRVKRKRLSAEEKLIEDNKAYYKVEVLNSKLRSTGYYLSQRELELSRINGSVDNPPCPGNTGDDTKNELKPVEKEPVVVRFKKVRKSELTLLSDEAESFMFGEPVRKERETSEETSGEESKKPSEECEKKFLKIKKEEVIDENSLGSCSVESNCSVNRKRRRTHAEMFIHDNLDYYKFEISNSRLRFHSSSYSPSPHCKSESLDNESKKILSSNQEGKPENKTETKSEYVASDIKDEKENVDLVTADVSSEGSVEDIQYSFEMIPESESWYQTYRRQDTCNEYYYPSYTDYPKRLLPYEYPSSERHQFLRRERRLIYRRRKSRFSKLIDDKPRKSPRCHASTLAIMSSLMRRKPRDSPDKHQKSSENEVINQKPPVPQPPPLNVQEEESCSSVPETICIPEIRIETKLPENNINYKDIAENISELFYRVYNESDDDRYLQTLKSIIKCLEAPTESDSVLPLKNSKSKSKSIKSSNTKYTDPSVDADELCLPVDPNVLVEAGDVNTCIRPGPTVDVITLIDNYRHSTSIERADYEHMHPRAVDALRALTVDNSSDCGGSSTCEGLSFFEDGRLGKRKYRKKKRNLTGWPLGRPRRRVVKKDDETTTPVNKRRGGGRKKANTSTSDSAEAEKSDTVVSSENVKSNLCDDGNNKDDNIPTVVSVHGDDNVNTTSCSISESVESSVATAAVPVSSLTRTVSLDSSPYSNNKNSEYQPCYIRVKKIPPPDCTADCKKEVLHSRHLRSSSSSDIFVSSPVKHFVVEDNGVDNSSTVMKKIPHKRKRLGRRWSRSYSFVRKFR